VSLIQYFRRQGANYSDSMFTLYDLPDGGLP
jgi:hypothetical protein